MTVKILETENDNDMREEIQARFDAALEDGKDELDVYSEMLETGIDIKMVRKYLGDDLPDIAEFVKTEKNKEGAACILLEEMQELGAVVGKEDDIPYIIFTKECKENYFRDRFTKVKKMVADMDLDEFSNSDLFTLRDTIQDNWGDMAYEDSMIPFDQFIRTAIPDAKYYIGNIIHLH